MFGFGKSADKSTTVVYEEPVPWSNGTGAGLRLEADARLPQAAKDLTGRARDLAGRGSDQAKDLAGRGTERARSLAGRGTDQARTLAERSADQALELTERGGDRARDLLERASEVTRSVAERLPDRDTALALVDRLPEPIRERANERLGRKRRSRWSKAGWIAAIAAGSVGALLLVKKAFAPGYAEEPLYAGAREDRAGGAGEPHAYPAEGSGSGWPEPQRTPASTETVDRQEMNGVASGGDRNGGAADAEPATPLVSTPHVSAGGEATATPASEMRTGSGEQIQGPSAREAAEAATAAAAQAPAGSFYALESRGGAAVPPEPSKPAQRPEVPFTEEQAEMNARLQLKQDELYRSFPGMTREDIVDCDGDLDRLAETLTRRSGLDLPAVRARLDEILNTAPDDMANPVRPDRD